MEKKNNPFKVPENYFEDFENRIAPLVGKTKKINFFTENKEVLRYAAMFVLLFTIGGIIYLTLPGNKNVTQTNIASNSLIDTIRQNLIPNVDAEKEVSVIDTDIKTKTQENKTQERKLDELKLNDEEIKYLEYYLQGDIHDYLTYNEIDL